MSSQFLQSALDKITAELAELKTRIAGVKADVDAAETLGAAQTAAAGLDELVDTTPAVTTEIDTISDVGTTDHPGAVFGR